MAQAGGKDPAKLTEALKMVEILIRINYINIFWLYFKGYLLVLEN